jgi:plasmid maintenance system antidote protein VapI
VSDIARQRRDVSADTAIRLAGYFGTDPRFWLNLQSAHDLSKAEREHDYSGLAPKESRSSINELIRQNKIQSFKVGGRRLVSRASLDALVDSNPDQAA